MVQSLILIISSVGLAVAGQLLLKAGMSRVGAVSIHNLIQKELIAKVASSPLVIGGLGLYILSAIIWLVVLSRVDLSFAYPFAGLGYVAVVLVSWLFLKEEVGLLRWIGVILICSGVIFISRS